MEVLQKLKAVFLDFYSGHERRDFCDQCWSELRSCVKVKVSILGSLFLISLMVSVDLKQHQTKLGGSCRVVNSLDFCLALLKSLGCFYFQCVLSSWWKAVTVNLWILHCQFQRHFWRPITCCLSYRIPQNAFFSQTRNLLASQKQCKDTFFHPPSPFPSNFCNCNCGIICTASQF